MSHLPTYLRSFGRVAFACRGEQLQQLEADVRTAGYSIHTPYVSLDTPGKATVQVVILQDPDGHEVRQGRERVGGWYSPGKKGNRGRKSTTAGATSRGRGDRSRYGPETRGRHPPHSSCN